MTAFILAAGAMLLAFMYGEMYHAVRRPGARESDHPPDVTETMLRHELAYHHRHHHHIPKHLNDFEVNR